MPARAVIVFTVVPAMCAAQVQCIHNMVKIQGSFLLDAPARNVHFVKAKPNTGYASPK
jgi:hypothetical protein